MKVNIADLIWSPFIYPRGAKSEETVRAYVEALRVGAKFPPIKIQRVFNYPGDNGEKIEATLILDGIHRWSANKECGYKKIEAISIDYGVMEKASNVVVFPFGSPWSDVGTWKGLADLAKQFGITLPEVVQDYLKQQLKT